MRIKKGMVLKTKNRGFPDKVKVKSVDSFSNISWNVVKVEVIDSLNSVSDLSKEEDMLYLPEDFLEREYSPIKNSIEKV